MHPVIPYVLAALLFGVGVYGVLVRRNAVLLLMAVELMLNAVNLVLVTADAAIRSVTHTGQVFALFVIVLAAAEIGVGLAIVLQLYRIRSSVAVDTVDLADQPDAAGQPDAVDQRSGAGAVDQPGDADAGTLSLGGRP
jgi:NADH-quinone oxidoreductase subunit K